MCAYPSSINLFRTIPGRRILSPKWKNSISCSTIIPHLIITQDKWNLYIGALKSLTLANFTWTQGTLRSSSPLKGHMYNFEMKFPHALIRLLLFSSNEIWFSGLVTLHSWLALSIQRPIYLSIHLFKFTPQLWFWDNHCHWDADSWLWFFWWLLTLE